jgi:hypothetical protein
MISEAAASASANAAPMIRRTPGPKNPASMLNFTIKRPPMARGDPADPDSPLCRNGPLAITAPPVAVGSAGMPPPASAKDVATGSASGSSTEASGVTSGWILIAGSGWRAEDSVSSVGTSPASRTSGTLLAARAAACDAAQSRYRHCPRREPVGLRCRLSKFADGRQGLILRPHPLRDDDASRPP